MKLKLKPMAAAISVIGLVSTDVLVAEENEWLRGVTISGGVQVEAQHKQDYDETKTSDFVVDEFSLGLDAQVHKLAKAHVVFLYEEGSTPLEIDEAILTLGNEEASPIYLNVGQMYVPFGNFESQMVSDPLTLGLAETREKAAQLGFKAGVFYSSVYAFNGDTQDDGENKIDHYGGNLGFAQETESISYDLGVGYINDIGDTDGLSETLEGVSDYDYVDGLSAHLVLNMGPVSLMGEYITALDEFQANHLAFKGQAAQPKAWNAEAGFTFNIAGIETTLAVGYQATEEALALELPESRILGVVSAGIYDNTTVSLEYAVDSDYDENDGGTGKDAKSAILQFAVEF